MGLAKKELPKRTRHAPPACLYSIQIEYARSDTANSSQAYNQPLLQFELLPPPHRASPDHLPSPQPNHPERFVFRQRCEPASGAVDRSVESHGPLSPWLEFRRIRWIVRHGGREGLRVEGHSCLIFLIYHPFFQTYSSFVIGLHTRDGFLQNSGVGLPYSCFYRAQHTCL